MNILDSAKETNNTRYSVDVTNMVDEGSLSESKLDSLLQRFLNGDFGTVSDGEKRRFAKHIDSGDLDIFGIYGNVMLYYDAQYDDLTFLTPDEFRNFYRIDWDNPGRKGYSVRYGGERQNIKTGKFVKMNQTRAVLRHLIEESLKKTSSANTTLARVDYKVFPHENLQPVLKVLKKTLVEKTMPDGTTFSGDAYSYLKKLVPDVTKLKNALLLFGYQHHVQHKNTEDSLRYVENAIAADVKALGAKDESSVKDEPDFTKKTAQGYDIVEVWESETGRKFIIMKRKTDYALGAGYDPKDGTWGAGYYDYDSAIDARQAMYREYPYNEFKRSKL